MATAWYIMETAQQHYQLSERLIRAVSDCRLNAHDTVLELINKGADVNQAHGTLLPLHCACMVSDNEMVQLLLRKGAKVDSVDGYHRTALHYAAEKDPECLELLLLHKANPDSLDANKNTPLHWASFKNKSECVRLLLRYGAYVDALDYNDDTPLLWAAHKCNYESISILLEYGADVHTINAGLQTSISRAACLLASGLEPRDELSLNLLIQAAGQFDLRMDGQLPSLVERDREMCNRMLAYCRNCRSLQQLCRYSIRKCLQGKHLPKVIAKLPIPVIMQRFLLLQT
ncbi:ankyrin repeat and SOCS box protein 8-like isoform X2 [Antedon mediterranea]